MYEWLTCLLVMLLLMWMGLFDEFFGFHFPKGTKEVSSLIVTSPIKCFPNWLVAWVDQAGGVVATCYLSIQWTRLGI